MPTSSTQAIAAQDRKFELLLFRLGEDVDMKQRELFGTNVFRVREIVVAPHVTSIVNAPKFNMGLVDVRRQLIPVIDLPPAVQCPREQTGQVCRVLRYASHPSNANVLGLPVDHSPSRR
jgi:two-component system, chemotaxis family, chemotaxis protein CheV